MTTTTPRARCIRGLRWGLPLVCALGLGLVIGTGGGCRSSEEKTKIEIKSRYVQRPLREVPEFLKGSIYEQVDLQNTEPQRVSAYAMVGGLKGTGSSEVPGQVRSYMIKEMEKHGYGSRRVPGLENWPPERVLRDPSFAVVRVDGFIPAGARRNQRFDVFVSTLPGNNTSSLAHGNLFRVDLGVNGANAMNPNIVNPMARAQGAIFLNPAYVVQGGGSADEDRDAASLSMRRGLVMNGAHSLLDRPLVLVLRQPQLSMSRTIERRIDDHFQEVRKSEWVAKQDRISAAQDEGMVYLYVPETFDGDWEHFAGVAMHLFLDNSPQFVAAKAKQLADEALKPDAPLMDISYCWEGLGPAALPFIVPLLSPQNPPEVVFAAARAAAFLKDESAQEALLNIARTPDHKFQVNAVQVLGALPNSQSVNAKLRTLLQSDQGLVRVEAYRVLARNGDPIIFSKVIEEKFILDMVPSGGPPMIYASRTGLPRIAIFGDKTMIERPITFTAMGNHFSLSSSATSDVLTLFYRGDSGGRAIKVTSNPDLAELIARLGGMGPEREPKLDFTYADIVGMLQALADQKKLVASGANGQLAPTAFVMQDQPAVQDEIYSAPVIPADTSRPQSDGPEGANPIDRANDEQNSSNSSTPAAAAGTME